LTAPAATSGQPKADSPSIHPASDGPAAEARLRGTVVMLAAAGRSSGSTIAITYELRVGTSICDRKLRTRKSATTTAKLSTKGIAARHRFAGMCVNTIVFTSPIRSAMRTAMRNETAESTLVAKKSAPTSAGLTPWRW
jgi:hypothetical protein